MTLEGFKIDDTKTAQVYQDLYVFDGSKPSLTCFSDFNLQSGAN